MSDASMAGGSVVTAGDAVPGEASTPALQGISLTPSAARRVAALREMQGNPELMLRLTVSGGGCSGFQYGFSFDTARQEDDLVFEQDGVSVVIDECSLELVDGSQIDYVEELLGSFFQVVNPLASSSCGCGTSFAI